MSRHRLVVLRSQGFRLTPWVVNPGATERARVTRQRFAEQFRVECACGWKENAESAREARARYERHEKWSPARAARGLALALAVLIAFPRDANASPYIAEPYTPKWSGPCASRYYDVLRSTPRETARASAVSLIRCLDTWKPWPGGVETALRVAFGESSFDAFNENACCAGLFQFHERYWPYWVRTYLPRRFFRDWPYVSRFDVRANAMLALLVARHEGWEKWDAY